MDLEPKWYDEVNPSWEYFSVYRKVRAALAALPNYFSSTTNIEGLDATDLFTLNSLLGASIENQVVDTLNGLRSFWDPDGCWATWRFVRQPQYFPDVLFFDLATSDRTRVIAFGIELKGWYLLSKEGVPSFRFKTTPAACAEPDLLVVIPWALTNVLSGRPRIFRPFIVPARYAAEFRNLKWEEEHKGNGTGEIKHPENAEPYPQGRENIQDQATYDNGGNFGRIARTGLLDAFIDDLMQENLCGISAKRWIEFFKKATKGHDQFSQEVDDITKRIKKDSRKTDTGSNELKRLLDDLRVLIAEYE